MRFFLLGRCKDPLIDFTGQIYNGAMFGERREPPEPGRAFARICKGGRKWYDCHSTTYFHKGIYVLNERVAEGVDTARLTGIELYYITFERSENKALPIESAPMCRWTLFRGTMAARVYNSQGLLCPTDSTSGHYVIEAGSRHVLKLDIHSWDGSDFFFLSTGDWGYRFVSEKVVAAAAAYRWTNFVFLPLSESHEIEIGKYQAALNYL